MATSSIYLRRTDFNLIASSRQWTSADSKATYPLDWQISIPSQQISFTTRAMLDRQEMLLLHLDRAVISSRRHHFIADEMQPDNGWLWLVKKISQDRFFDINPQLLPRVALGKNVLSQTLRCKSAISFLSNAKSDFHEWLNGRVKQ